MNAEDNSLFELFEVMKKKAPEYFDLMTAKSDSEFEAAFETLLEKAISSLEQNGKNFESLGEDGLSGALALALSMPGLAVTQETNSNGHVDLTIMVDHCSPMRKKLGEAKIYDGPIYHFKGLEQLIERYSTGREGRGLLIEYFRKQNIAGLVSILRERMDSDLPCAQKGQTQGLGIKWSFLSTHTHSSGENLEVSHIGCNLCTDHKTNSTQHSD